jgi:hypothetical protein
MSVKTQLLEVFTKLTQLKVTLNKYAEGLTLEEYDHLYGDIEELQGLVSDVMGGVREYNMDGGLGVDWVKAC